jgi:predicted PurR-regulated permease PerM
MLTAERSRATMLILTMAAFVVIIAGLKAAQDIIIPFLLAGFIAIICGPPVFWLRQKKLPTGLAILVVIIGVSLCGLLVTALIGSSINDFTNELPVYQVKIDIKIIELAGLLGRVGLNIEDRTLSEYIDPGAAMYFADKLLSGFGKVLGNTFIILLTVIFILLEASSFRTKIKMVSIDQRPGFSLADFDHFIAGVNQYMVIKTWVSLATGIFVAAWLAVLNVDYPLLWGLLAFLLNYVPNIGSIIAAVPATLLALIQLGATTALLTVSGYALVNIVLGNMIEPRFMGKGLGLSTLVVFISLAFWGWVLGPVGMLLSVPLTMILKIALAGNSTTRWISTMMA